jgi:hypothetical protein
MLFIEHTDTFGGEANYSWCRRWFCRAPLTPAQEVRLAKRLTGYTGHPCKKEDSGDMTTLRPRGVCHVIFLTYTDEARGKEVDAQGNEVEA